MKLSRLHKINEGRYLAFYKRCIERGALPSAGLCGTRISNTPLFDQITPSASDINKLRKANLPSSFWGMETFSVTGLRDFTPLRQNLVLLLAAMNNEL